MRSSAAHCRQFDAQQFGIDLGRRVQISRRENELRLGHWHFESTGHTLGERFDMLRRDMRRTGFVIGLGVARLQQLESRVQCVRTHMKGVKVAWLRVTACKQVLDRGLEPVSHFAKPHRSRQASSAFQRVQGAHAGRSERHFARTARPIAKTRSELCQQLLAFFFEDREQLGVHRIDGIDVVVIIERIGAYRLDPPRFDRQVV